MQFILRFILLISALGILGCSADKTELEEETDSKKPDSEIASKDRIAGIRIAWDYKTMLQISAENDAGYNGYARVIQLEDETLLLTYESNGNILVKKSEDNGQSWSDGIVVSPFKEGVNMATPDLLELDNGAILLAYNPRPGETAAPDRKFLIKTILSNDGGINWQNDQIVYEGDTEFGNGVWEPSAIQLPGGEIQLFFSNENVYQNSNEQNISLLRSADHGLSWTKEPEIASFRAGSRDGMPSPLFLKAQNEIIFSIEDNGDNNQFKPYIIRNSVSENWSQPVDGSDENRSYALKGSLEESEYAGAPYLAQLKTGETLISYQGTDYRNGNDLNNADMKVAIGDINAKNFDRTTTPFLIPENKSALWNSIAVLEDNWVMALTTTNAFSGSNHSEVWMIKGQVIPELKAGNNSVSIDGETSEDIWKQDFPVFIGQKGETQLQASISVDDTNLYIISKISDKNISTNSDNIQNTDGMVVYLDPSNKSYIQPDKGLFKINISAANKIKMFEGDNSEWIETEISGIDTKTTINDQGYIREIAIPWNSIGGKPDIDNRIGFSMELIERGNANYSEMISTTQPNAPHTWLGLKLKR